MIIIVHNKSIEKKKQANNKKGKTDKSFNNKK